MKLKNTVSLIKGDFQVVEVVFASGGGRDYFYKAPLTETFQRGDIVAVPVQDSPIKILDEVGESKTATPVKLAKVIQTHGTMVLDYDADYEYKWVVSKVDTEPFLQQVRQDEADAEKLMVARQENLRRQMVANLPEVELKALGVSPDDLAAEEPEALFKVVVK